MSDSALNNAVLTQVMTHLRDGNFRRCLELGFKHDELSQLNGLSLGDIGALGRMPIRFVNVSINHDLLTRALERLHEESDRQALIGRAITLGASIQMLNELFGVSSEEVSTRRRMMGITVKSGRNPMPDVTETHLTWIRWKELCIEAGISLDDSLENKDPTAILDLMMMLAEETHLPLSIIKRLLEQWKDDSQALRSRNQPRQRRQSPHSKPAPGDEAGLCSTGAE